MTKLQCKKCANSFDYDPYNFHKQCILQAQKGWAIWWSDSTNYPAHVNHSISLNIDKAKYHLCPKHNPNFIKINIKT